MQDIDKELRKHKFVIFGSDHYNTLGAVRSLGEVGIRPDVILHPHYSPNPILLQIVNILAMFILSKQ